MYRTYGLFWGEKYSLAFIQICLAFLQRCKGNTHSILSGNVMLHFFQTAVRDDMQKSYALHKQQRDYTEVFPSRSVNFRRLGFLPFSPLLN
jgi:hypothetical protein